MYSDSDTVETVGFPIRKSMDQSLFAAPHGLSQRTTSFIASYRQGIHQMPLCHLIALIINAHPSGTAIDSEVFWLVCLISMLVSDLLAAICAQVAQSAVAHQKRAPTLRPDFHRD
jgi:hypothetical protein